MEIAHKINAEGNLVGIVNVPDSPRAGNPVVLFINGGFLHHIGPYRLYTDSARKLEALGFHVMRFDMTGLGDSAASGSGLAAGEQAQSDIRSAIDFMEDRYHCEEVLTAGLCSGADDALEAAEHDHRIRGILLLDGAGFRTHRFYVNRVLHHYASRLFSLQRWHRLLTRTWLALRAADKASLDPSMDGSIRASRSATELRECVSRLTERGVALHFLFTGGVFNYYNYSGQVFDMLSGVDLHGKVTETYHRHCDHMFLLNRHRTEVRNEMEEWMSQQAGGVAS